MSGSDHSKARTDAPINPQNVEIQSPPVHVDATSNSANGQGRVKAGTGNGSRDEDVEANEEAARHLSSELDRLPLKRLTRERAARVLESERVAPKPQVNEDGQIDGIGTGQYQEVIRKIGRSASMSEYAEHGTAEIKAQIDDTHRNRPSYAPDLYTIAKYGALDTTRTNLSDIPFKKLIAQIEDLTLPPQRRLDMLKAQITRLADVQTKGLPSRSYLAPEELQSLSNLPTSAVSEAMEANITDLSDKADNSEMKDQPTATHNCSSCQAIDALIRDKKFLDLKDYQEKRWRVLNYALDKMANNGEACVPMPCVPGIDLLIQAFLPRTQESLPSPEDLGLGTGIEEVASTLVSNGTRAPTTNNGHVSSLPPTAVDTVNQSRNSTAAKIPTSQAGNPSLGAPTGGKGLNTLFGGTNLEDDDDAAENTEPRGTKRPCDDEDLGLGMEHNPFKTMKKER